MPSFADFKKSLQDALNHLDEPSYQPGELLYTALRCEHSMVAVQDALVRAIEHLKPTADTPLTARARRSYDILLHRYVQRLTQEETAQAMNVSPRHVRREQDDAVYTLAAHLWPWEQERQAALPNMSVGNEGTAAWRLQVKQELAALQQHSVGSATSVQHVLMDLHEVMATLAARYGAQYVLQPIPANLVARIHPSVLREALVSAADRLARAGANGKVSIGAQRNDGRIVISISAYPAESGQDVVADASVQEVLAAENADIATNTDDGRLSMTISLPVVERLVLLVDDNLDILQLYSFYTIGTPYALVHVGEGKRVMENVETYAPAAIVLDVMLPDVDGWSLLSQLRQDPRTAHIPIIICSVMEEADLALTLGAAGYLRKPIQRDQFIAALDRALNQA
jgi:CheY-like chemotaxis protein